MAAIRQNCMSVKQRKVIVTLVCTLLLLGVTPLFGQETTGAVQGTVKDPQGAVVPSASVEISGPALIGTKKSTTDQGGYYRIANLPPGTYEINVSAGGFGPSKQTGLQLQAGQLPTINLTLKLGGTTETIEVSAEAAMIDVTQSKVQTTVSEQVLNNIPKGRSYQSVIPFAPGARQEPLQSRRDDPGRGNGFQIDGASDSENVYLVEGMNTTNIQDGGVGKNVPTEFVQEVQIKSSSFEAEFGGALGGVVNVVQKRGSNAWHGSIFTYYRSSALDANDQCQTRGLELTTLRNTQCGLRNNPLSTNNAAARSDFSAEYFLQKQDHYRTVEPGFDVGGPVFKDRLWFFASYIPTLDRTSRTVNFTGTNPGLRTFKQSTDVHNAFARLDYRVANSLTLFASWQYGFSRTAGQLPTPDSLAGQRNNFASTDPNTIRSDTGNVQPSSIYNFGADWTPTPHLVITGRYGYFYNNFEDRGKPVGLRYLYQVTANAGTKGLDGTTLPAAFQNTANFSNIPDVQQQLFDVYQRKSWSADAAYFRGNWWGAHNFKVGYSQSRLANNTLNGFNTAEVDLYYGQNYTVGTAGSCNAIIAANVAAFGAGAAGQCRGNYGYFTVHDGVDVAGKVSSINHAFYFQDSWSVGHSGLTINAGVRFDKEFLPPYSAGADSISFGFGSKVAPRIGAAYDVLHNGKLKVYGSYGKFFDIMKYSLPRGSFGGEYWHDCTYALDNPDFNAITPTAPGNHGCPVSGPAPGVTGARFVENQDFRLNVLNPTDPGVDPNIKPMQQHEWVFGSDWAITPKLGLEVRYSRKRLDQTIEDIGLNDNLGFYIGNPGPNRFADLLHRPVQGSGILAPVCPTCPVQEKANRNYDGLEFRLTKQASNRWFGTVSYTYSRLYGNYSGLTDTDISDGNGGRHSPNNHRAFDQPQLESTAHGTYSDGPLGTDRPHALKFFGYVQQKWFAGQTTLGFDQSIFSGTPVSTCWPTINTASSCEFVEGRGKFVNLHRDPANGNFVSDGVVERRSPAYIQTDANFVHEFRSFSKTNENLRLGFEMNVQNLLNQHSAVGYFINPLTTGAVSPATAANPTGFDYLALMTGWDYIATTNGANSTSGAKTLSNRYGLPNLFQQGRTVRFKLKFTF